MTRVKLKMLIFSLLLLCNTVSMGQEKISSIETPNSQVAVKEVTVNKIEKVEDKPKTVDVKVEKSVQIIPIILSFYTNSLEDCSSTAGISASGKNLVQASRENSSITYVAAPKNIPFGTRINVNGLGTCEVVDRGSAIKWVYTKDGTRCLRLDVFVYKATKKQLLDRGVIKTNGYILK